MRLPRAAHLPISTGIIKYGTLSKRSLQRSRLSARRINFRSVPMFESIDKGASAMVPSASLACTTCRVLNTPGSSLCVSCHRPLLLSAYLLSQIFFHVRFRIIDKLGTGGFGSVYKARDTRRDHDLVAIKEFCLRGLTSQELVEATSAFQREGNLLSQLTHPSLPRLHEQICRLEQWYLVMDFLEGE